MDRRGRRHVRRGRAGDRGRARHAWARPTPTTSPRPPRRRPRRRRSGRRCRTPRAPRVLRKAGDLWAEHAEEIRDWNVREVGAIPPMAGFAMHVAAEECYEAASLPGQPIGEVLPSEQPRLSMARQVPAGVVAVISPFNVPIILGIRSVAPALALGNAVHPQARPAHRGHRRHRDGADLRGGRAAGRRAADAARRQGRRRGDGHRPARPGHLVHRLDRGRPVDRRARRPPPQARPPRARRQLRAARPRRRRRRAGGGADRLGVVPPPGPDLHDHRPLLRRRRDLRRLRRAAGREGRPPAGRRPGHRAGRPRAGHRRGLARQDPRAGHRQRRPGRPAGRRWRVRPALLPAHRARRGPAQLTGLHRGGLRPGRAGHPGLVGRGRRPPRRARASTASRSASSPAT